MAGVKAKLTKRSVDAFAAPAEGELQVWDTELKGFLLRVRPSGRKTYAVFYRLGAAQRWLTIGAHGSPWTPENARLAAKAALAKAAANEDPAEVKREARAALTVAMLIDAYLADGPATKPAKRANTWMHDASNLNRHIKPLIGSKLAGRVTKAEAARAFADIVAGKTAADVRTGNKGGRAIVRGGEGAARRTRITAAACWAWGLEYDYIKGVNPWAGMKLTAAPVRERFLSRAEAGKLLDTITAREGAGLLSQTFGDAIRLLLLTGARKSEVLGLTWAEVDFDRKVATLPPERTKAGGHLGARRLHLSPPALAILSRRRAERDALEGEARSGFVFPAARGSGHAIGVRKPFTEVLAQAGLEAVRVHDLRHSFASFALADGASLYLIGKALGHANASTTQRYAHLSGDVLADLSDAVGARIMPTPPPADTAEVIPLRSA